MSPRCIYFVRDMCQVQLSSHHVIFIILFSITLYISLLWFSLIVVQINFISHRERVNLKNSKPSKRNGDIFLRKHVVTYPAELKSLSTEYIVAGIKLQSTYCENEVFSLRCFTSIFSKQDND